MKTVNERTAHLSKGSIRIVGQVFDALAFAVVVNIPRDIRRTGLVMKPKHVGMIGSGGIGMAIVLGILLLVPELWWLALILAAGWCVGLFILNRMV